MAKPKLTREKELETILTICVGLVVLFLITKSQHRWLLSLSILLGLIGMFSAFITAKIAWAWMKVAELMGEVSSKVILTLIFFGFLLPVALLSKMFGSKGNLVLKKSGGSSYYFTRNHKFESKDLENPW